MKFLLALLVLVLVSASCGQLPTDDAPTSAETTRAPSRPSTETTLPPPQAPPEPDTEEQLKTLESPSTTTKRSYPTTSSTTLPSTPPLVQCGVIHDEGNYAHFLEIRTTPSMPSDVEEFLEEGELDVRFVCDKVAELTDGRVVAYSPNGSPCASVEQKGLRLNMTFTAPPSLEDIEADLCSTTAKLLGAMIHAEIAAIHGERAKELAKKATDSIMKCLVKGVFLTSCHNPDAMP